MNDEFKKRFEFLKDEHHALVIKKNELLFPKRVKAGTR